MVDFSIYLNNILVGCRAQFEYPKTFIIGIISQWLGYGVQFVTTWILIKSFGNLNGWAPVEVLFLYAIQLITYGIAALFVANTLSLLPELIKSGDFDVILTKPINSLAYLMTINFNIGYIGHITLSIIIILICWNVIGIPISFSNIFCIVCSIIGGTLITGAILIIAITPSLRWVGENQLPQFVFNLRSFINYPLSMYSKGIQLFFTFILPYGFINFYPIQHILNNERAIFNSPFVNIIPITIGIMFTLLARRLWYFTINHYYSTGS